MLTNPSSGVQGFEARVPGLGCRFPERTHLFLILALTLLVRLPDLPYHYVNWDEGESMSQAWAMTQGLKLYKDIFQIHPILHFAILYPFFLFLSPDLAPHVIKFLNMVLVGAGGIVVYRSCPRWSGREIPSLLSALIFVFYLGRFWALSSLGAFYAIFPILLSFYLLFLRPNPSRRISYFCGLLWGIAVFTKQVAILDVVALYLCLVFWRRQLAPKILTASFYLFLGFGSVVTGVSAYFVWQGTFHDAMQNSLLRPIAGYAQLGPDEGASLSGVLMGRLRLLYDSLAKITLTFAIPLLGMAMGMFRAALERNDHAGARHPDSPLSPEAFRSRSLFCVLLIWLGADLVGILLVGRFYDHYMMPLVPGISLTCVYWVSGLDGRSMRSLAGAVMMVVFAAAAFHFIRQVREDGLIPFKVRKSVAIAAYITAHTGRNDTIFLYRFGGTDVFYLSQRLPNNGIYEYVEMCEDHMKDRAMAARKREEFQRRLPEIIAMDPKVSVFGCESSADFFDQIIASSYGRTTIIYGVEIYQRRHDG
jgi:hypothetical protein